MKAPKTPVRFPSAPARSLLAAMSLTAVAALPAKADTFHQTVNDTSDSSPNWNQALWGDPAAAPTSGNHYISDSADGMTQVRTSNPASSTFAGDTLTLRGTTLISKTSVSVNLILENDGAFSAGSNTTFNNGSLTVASGQTGVISTGTRTITFNAPIHGSGELAVTSGGAGFLNVNSTTSTFSGTWILENTVSVSGIGAGSLGTTSSFIVNGGSLDIQYAFNSALSSLLMTAGTFDLNAGIDQAFGSVTIGGTALSAGTYAYADFAPEMQSYFVDGGGTITVIPESSTYALLGGLAALGFAVRRRRARS